MGINITKYEAICNLGENIEEIFDNALSGINDRFISREDIIIGKNVRAGMINADLPEITDEKFNTRCNRLILKCLENLNVKEIINNFGEKNIAVVVATTNSGVEEFSYSQNKFHSELGNPALFVKSYFKLKNLALTVSTACSSGVKVFSVARNLLNSDIAKAVLVIGCDTLARVPVFGFDSLGVLSEKPSNPLSKNITGINIGEAVAAFIVEKNSSKGISIKGTGETSDFYNSSSPDPEAKESINAINSALKNAKINPADVDYVNLHGTGTLANDLSEACAVFEIFGKNTPVSSTKPLTGHCLGASASIETALCCKLLENFDGRLFPHVYDEEYNTDLPALNIVKKNAIYKECNIIVCNSFGFGGSNAIIILGKQK